MALTKSNTTNTLLGAARPTSRSILHTSRLNRTCLALTSSNVSTTRAIIKLTPIPVCSGTISSTKSGIQRNIKNSGSPGPSQFNCEQQQLMIIKDIKIFLQNMQKNNLSHHQHDSRDSI